MSMLNLRRRAWFGAFLLIALVAIAYYFRNALHGFSWTRVVSAVAQIRLSFVLAAVATTFAAYATRTRRWQRFCRWCGGCSFLDTFDATLMGFAGVCLLSRAGEALRPVLLARKCRLRVATMFGIWLLERLFDVASAASLLMLSLLLPSRLLSTGDSASGWQNKIRLAGLLVAAGLAGAIVMVTYFRLHGAGLLDRYLATWRAESGWKRRVAVQFGDFGEGLQAIRTFPDLAAAVFYSAVHWGLVTVCYFLIARSFGGRLGEFDLRGAMLLVVITLFGSALQLPGVGGGTQVLAFIGLTQVFRIEQEPAAAAAMLIWIINGVAVCFPGVPLLIREGWSMASLRSFAKAGVQAEQGEADASAIGGRAE